MPQPPSYVLDTNVLIHYARASVAGRAIEARFQFRAMAFKPSVCVVTIGEVLAFSQRRRWGKPKLALLEALLDSVVQLSIDPPEILRAYADIHTHCVNSGLALGDNDLWIAAVTKVTGACLITTDRDFDSISPMIIRRTFVDPMTGVIEQ